jgi:amino acid adenylation domain-containing protein
MRGRLNRTALAEAFGDLVARHESLRTIYPESAGLPRQEILPSFAPVLTEETVSEGGLQDAMTAQCQRGFNLVSEPPLRAHLLSLAPDDTVLLLQIHHIAGDGFSLMALAKDLSAAYGARVRGEAPQWTPLPVQYADFAAYQLGLLGKTNEPESAVSRQIAFWKTALQDLPDEIDLPKDRPRPPVATYRGDRIPMRLDRSLHQRLVAIAADTQSSVFMVLQAALAVLLTRLGAGTDIPIGSPIAGRTDKSLTDVVGCFVNMLVMRTDTSGDPTFRELIGRVRTANLDAYANQDLPFERLVEELNPERSLARHPLFQVMLAFLNTSRIEFKLPQLETSLEPVNTRTAQYDLSFYLNERRAADGAPQGIEGVLEFSTELFDVATAQRMADGLLHLLGAAVAEPDSRISKLPLLTSDERETLLKRWNDTAAEIPDGAIHALFERQVDRTPDQTAVIFGEARLTYSELEERANRIAHTLRARGARRGHRVGLSIERGIDLLPALLGILKSGACYVPLDPAFPPERLQYMAENADLDALVTTETVAETFDLCRDRLLLLDSDAALIAAEPAGRLTADEYAATPDDPAYMLYTSGSTGKPKGVVVPHLAVVNFLTSMALQPGIGSRDTLLAITTLSFDIAVLELYLPLTIGAQVVIASRDDALDGEALSALLASTGATMMQATPASWRLLIDADWRTTHPFKALVGGEALSRALADELISRGAEVWNMYGPTETTVWSTCARISATDEGLTIGKPIANTVVTIVDENGELVPIGVPGELLIGGTGLATGYWKLPELTAERFIDHPHASAGWGRLYRTGDRARWRNDGTLEHLGRLDDQVKVRGYRIELGEIETVLAEHPDVRQAAVRLHQVGPDDVRIIAYFVPAVAGIAATSALRKHTRTRLPDYMVPQSFLPIESLPLTPNGKVDRRRLPLPATAESRSVIPETLSDPIEIAIAEIWTALIAPSRPIRSSDRFFEMGGHSLLALQALRQMEAKTGVRLDLRTLFQDTLAEIATRASAQHDPEPATVTSPVAAAYRPLGGLLRLLRSNGAGR